MPARRALLQRTAVSQKPALAEHQSSASCPRALHESLKSSGATAMGLSSTSLLGSREVKIDNHCGGQASSRSHLSKKPEGAEKACSGKLARSCARHLSAPMPASVL